jgi:PAS domain S-box-containing protein
MKKGDAWDQFLSSAIEQSFEGIAIADLDYKLLYVNPAWTEMHGYDSGKELIGKSINIFHSQEQVDKLVKHFIRVVNDNGKNRGEMEHIRKDGTPFPTMMTTTLLKDMQGLPVAILGIAQDITKRKQAEKQLKQSKEVSETILNSMNDAVSLISTDNYSIIDVNKAFMEQYGLSKKNIIGRYCYEVTHNQQEPCYPPNDICPLSETVQKARSAHAEHIHFLPDGSKTFAEITTSPIIDEGGKVKQVVHIARNITKRKQAEEEREKLIIELQKALSEIKILRGLLPICMNCRKIKTEQGSWKKLETYIAKHSDVEFSHGICPDCFKKQMEVLKREI